MSVVALAPDFEDADANIETIVRFQRYADDTHDHLVRVAEMLADGEQVLLKDLLVVVAFLWA